MWDNLPPEKRLQLCIAQADIILCWIIYIAKIVAISMAAVFCLFLVIRLLLRMNRRKGGVTK